MNREAFILELEGYLKARAAAKKALESCPATMEIEYRARIAAIDAQIDAHIAQALAPAAPVLTPEPTPAAPAAALDEAPAREIRITRNSRGRYDFKTPRLNDAFLHEFKTRIGKPFRFWNTRGEFWQITPADDEMVDLVAAIVRRHFPGYVVTVDHATEIPIETRHQALFDAVPKRAGVGFLGAQPR